MTIKKKPLRRNVIAGVEKHQTLDRKKLNNSCKWIARPVHSGTRKMRMRCSSLFKTKKQIARQNGKDVPFFSNVAIEQEEQEGLPQSIWPSTIDLADRRCIGMREILDFTLDLRLLETRLSSGRPARVFSYSENKKRRRFQGRASGRSNRCWPQTA